MKIRDRILGLRRVKASELMPHPANWRRHPEGQAQAVRAILAEVGWAGAALAYETAGGLRLIDGHLRAELAPDAEIPVLVLDVTDEEARKILATHDPLAGMAEPDSGRLSSLLSEIRFDGAALREMVAGIVTPVASPALGPDLDESIADGVSVCVCPTCGQEHHAVSE